MSRLNARIGGVYWFCTILIYLGIVPPANYLFSLEQLPLAYVRALSVYHPCLLITFSYSSSLCLLFNPYGPVSPSLIVSTIFNSFNVICQNSVLQTVLHVEYWICTLTSKKWIGPFNSITMTLQTPSTIFKRCFLSSFEIALFLKNQTSNSHPARSLVLF